MKKIITVIGARPQFIKASVVSRALAEVGHLEEVLVHTGQHFDANMSDVFFSELSMSEPRYNLNIHGGLHGEMTGQMLAGLEKVLIEERPHAVLVYGDTNSTLAGALAAVKLHIPVAHVEAGLRSFNMRMPEEVNRILTDRISTWLFAPTETAARHLHQEGFAAEKVHTVGDVMYDVALRIGEQVSPDGGVLLKHGLRPGAYILATIHRAENTDSESRLKNIVEALEDAASRMPVVWPLHPRTRAVLQRCGWLERLEGRVHVIEPVGYLDMVQLEKYAALVATDSGGVQKEAYFYRVPCVTLRDETEWIELVESGWNRLAPPADADLLRTALDEALGSRGQALSLYGAGNAAEQIAARLAAEIS